MAERASHVRKTSASWPRLVLPLMLTAAISGSLSALFLVSLEMVTRWHAQHRWLLLGLPLAGMGMVWLYQKYGGLAGRGSHLLVEEIHELRGHVPLRMAPLVLITTLVTHLFGGSAGREGTAVQMGGAVSAWLSRVFALGPSQQRTLLMAGIAAGFGAVFGTPFAGAVFAVELPVRGRWQIRGLLPCLGASWLGHLTCHLWGVMHIDYRALGLSPAGMGSVSWPLLAAVALAALLFGLCGRLFVALSHQAPLWLERCCPRPWARPVVGGLMVIGLVYALGNADYLGLGVSPQRDGGVCLLSSFSPGGADSWSWWWKMLFTVITLSSGFKGGEVTPLFFIGAALGNALAMATGQPVALFAGLGMVAVFAAAANTPLACAILGWELFGPHHAMLFAVTCLIAFLVSGRAGIYQHQR